MSNVVSRIGLIIVSLAFVFAIQSCNHDLEIIYKIIDTEIEPDLTVNNIETLHFDSARLQVRMVSPLMKQFTSASKQRQEFPEGIQVWLYEKSGEFRSEITANWAIHDIDDDIWEARGDVVVVNAEGQKIETEQLFWDVGRAMIYSNVYTKITQTNGSEFSGDSFESNQEFTEYRLNNTSRVGRTIIFIEDDDNTLEDDVTEADEYESDTDE